MKLKGGRKFSEKHEADAKIDKKIKEKILSHAKDEELACAVAFKIADELHVSPAEVGKIADLLEMKLSKCQLGLFGYKPDKKIVKPKVPENQTLKEAIRAAMVAETLSCEKAWDIALTFDVSKMTVSAACEALKIKLKPCQLGAF